MGIIKSQLVISLTVFLAIWISCITLVTNKALSQSNITDVTESIQLENSNTFSIGNDSNDLLNQIRVATRHFRQIGEAEKAGYRPFGPDMPNMGQHWINTRMALEPNIDFNKPSTLTYLTINGEAILTGVAYTTSIQSGEVPPILPSQEMKWHYHSGNLEDEAHGIHRKTQHGPDENKPKLAMLHAWVWVDNPNGMYTADNWALSFYRHNLVPPKVINVEASKALFLASGKVNYYLKFIELCLNDNTFDTQKVKNVLYIYSGKIKVYASSLPSHRMLSDQEQLNIQEKWDEMWNLIRENLAPQLWVKVDLYR